MKNKTLATAAMAACATDQGTLIRPELRKETTKQNHNRVMRSGSWIQTTGPNNGHQLRDYSKSSNRSENSPLIYMEDKYFNYEEK